MLPARWLLLCRGLHSSQFRFAVDKALLSKLRKKTGFPFINCRKALQQFDNDVSKAESWLREQAQKEGWAKASKLQGRPMSQGLIGVMVEKNMAVMVEVNCETDFVSRNAKFHALVSKAAGTCLQFGTSASEDKALLDKDKVNQLKDNEGQAMADLVALTVGEIGENMALRRAVCLRVGDGVSLGTYVHSAGPQALRANQCIMGKYGSLVVFKQSNPAVDSPLSTNELGRQLCQHIVGMNPKSVGSEEDESPANANGGSEEGQSRANANGGSEEEAARPSADGETRMVFQEFLLDQTLTVQEFLQQNAANVVDFVRFECGESLPGDD